VQQRLAHADREFNATNWKAVGSKILLFICNFISTTSWACYGCHLSGEAENKSRSL